jgi:YVTN family beta-propeller protein
VATIPVPGSSDARSVTVGGGSVWVTDSGTQTVTRVNPSDNRVVASIHVGGAPVGIVYGFDVWVSTNRVWPSEAPCGPSESPGFDNPFVPLAVLNAVGVRYASSGGQSANTPPAPC